MQLLILQPGFKQQESEPPSMKALISDPYIIMAAGKYRKFYLPALQLCFYRNSPDCVFRSDNICKYGNSNARTFFTNLDDGYDGR